MGAVAMLRADGPVMLRHQITMKKTPAFRHGPDLAAVLDLLSPRFTEALAAVHEALDRAGVRHALCGGLAAGAYGEPRATQDIDFLVGDEAFFHSGPLVMLRAGVPLEALGIAVDSIPIPVGHAWLDEAVENPPTDSGIPILRPEHLVYMKLLSPRRKDAFDISAMIRHGLDLAAARALAARGGPELVARLDALAAEADAEE